MKPLLFSGNAAPGVAEGGSLFRGSGLDADKNVHGALARARFASNEVGKNVRQTVARARVALDFRILKN